MECTEKWTDSEVQALLSIYSSVEIQKDSDSGRRNIRIYENIAVQLLHLGIHHTSKQCREKIKKLKQDYRKIKEHNNQSGSNFRSGKWFAAMDAILGHKPVYARNAGTNNSAIALSDGIGSDTDTSVEVNDFKQNWKVPPDAFVKRKSHMQSKSSRITQLEEISLDMSVVEEDITEPDMLYISTPESPLLPSSKPVTPTQPAGQATDTSTSASCQHLLNPFPHPKARALMPEQQQGTQKRKRLPSAVEEQLLDIITQTNSPILPHVPREVDEMYYFALSLVPKLNRLHPRNQTKAQIHILQYLADLELEDKQQHQQPTSAVPAFKS
ncbi:uncharacterized protein [Paramisgurnus dabryanus]|uniref:uncharacterized protein n=1 Tax=Paramisgurnus dabryanus TaxID=90735 RepID=UPI0031F37C67